MVTISSQKISEGHSTAADADKMGSNGAEAAVAPRRLLRYPERHANVPRRPLDAARDPSTGRTEMKNLIPGYRLAIAASVMLALLAPAQAEPVGPAAKSIKAEETAILLVDFQANFVSPDGAWYGKFKEHYAKTRSQAD